MIKTLLLFFAFISFTTLSFTQYEHLERIISFESEININEDASMIVSEKIKVYATGNKIKRGIYRDFPTKYKDSYGNNINIRFDVLEILRDGNSENYHTEILSNGVRVYLGKNDNYLSEGEYSYTIKYKTYKQIGFFDNFDELYWNVTGNGWDFIIENVNAIVTLPANVLSSDLKTFGYTGIIGSTEKDYTVQIINSKKIIFKTKFVLNPGEGLTIGVQWSKGMVYEPTNADKLFFFIEDNLQAVIALVGLFALITYYLIIWWKVGKDPEKGIIIPLYRAPVNLSPSAARFISEMGYDNKTFTSTIVTLAVKGYLKIEESSDEYFLMKTNSGNKTLTSDEKAVLDKLRFTSDNGKQILKLKQANHTTIQNAIRSHKNSLKNSFDKKYFFTNRKYFIIGLLISVIVLIISNIKASGDQVFSLIWITFWSFAVAFLLFNVSRTWKSALSKSKSKFASLTGAIFFSLFSIPFIIGEFAGLYFLSDASSPLMLASVGLMIGANIIFYNLLKAPTLLGRKIMDEIDGFKLYLGTAEKDRLDSIKEPTKTPELFEEFLPYALALNVENKWAEKFSDIFSGIQEKSTTYKPNWYSGTNWSTLGAAGFASSLSGSFASSISSSATAPGSSSGGGSGSSGGGGGGGGGGGW